VATIKNEFPLAQAAKRFAAFALVGAGLFAAPLLAERVTLGEATSISAVAREGAKTSPAPVAASRRIDMAWEMEARRSREMTGRDVAPARLDRIPPRIMLALR
jgi:hypothetical protein